LSAWQGSGVFSAPATGLRAAVLGTPRTCWALGAAAGSAFQLCTGFCPALDMEKKKKVCRILCRIEILGSTYLYQVTLWSMQNI